MSLNSAANPLERAYSSRPLTGLTLRYLMSSPTPFAFTTLDSSGVVIHGPQLCMDWSPWGFTTG